MSLCDPHRHTPRPVPSTGERPGAKTWTWICEFCFRFIYDAKLPDDWLWLYQSAICPECSPKILRDGGINLVKCGAYAGDRTDPRCSLSTRSPRTEQLPGEPKFNSLHISHLPLKIEGQTIHLFVAILNGEAVGQIIAQKGENRCDLRMLYVAQKHRHMGIGSRLVSRAQVFAHNEGCNSMEIAVHEGNTEARKFWIRRKFIDDDDKPGLPPDYQCMAREI